MASQYGPIEVALSSDLRGAPYSFSLWDIYTGAQLVVFKGIKANPISGCVRLINDGYFLTAIDNVVQIWSIYNRKSQDQKLFLPGRPSSMAVSPCGNYLVGGISEMIYIWQLCSGNLLAHAQRHYQTVTNLKINSDGTFLFSGAEDGMVLVWPFGDLVSKTHNTGSLKLDKSRKDVGVNEPRFTWQHHNAKITDIYITNGGRCFTASIDKTVNIYSYANGERLHCMSWPTSIWSVVVNKNETIAFLGGQDGNIYRLAISTLGLSHIISDKNEHDISEKPTLTGHTDKITSLSISMDGSLLISGSNDSSCKIWDLIQGKMVRDIKHQAPIANLITMMIPEEFSLNSLTQNHTKPPLVVKQLKRSVFKPQRDNVISKDDIFDEACTTILYLRNKHELLEPEGFDTGSSKQVAQDNCDKGSSGSAQETLIKELKTTLKELYALSAEKIFKDAAIELIHTAKKARTLAK